MTLNKHDPYVRTVTEITANTTLTQSDSGKLIIVGNTARDTTITITLPDPIDFPSDVTTANYEILYVQASSRGFGAPCGDVKIVTANADTLAYAQIVTPGSGNFEGGDANQSRPVNTFFGGHTHALTTENAAEGLISNTHALYFTGSQAVTGDRIWIQALPVGGTYSASANAGAKADYLVWGACHKSGSVASGDLGPGAGITFKT